jgi:PHD/YefM family antitoxin component YafN of YafNO toxin-antitoxin module
MIMLNLHPQYVVNARGREIAVLLPLQEYERLLEELETQDDIRAANEAKAKGETPIPLEEALAQLDGRIAKRR